ncbi:MAG: 2-oxoacid:acceptor oxidoreductase family protein [Deltaproteobacteria bacterium]|nr:2-oxoacid:acceptor oxidoreductase family protein [Deltaproteobacteria bacterium]
MRDLKEIILAGTGGQGLGLVGQLLAQSFAEEEGKNVIQTEAYGISMRGGHSRAEVLVSSEEINELKVTEPDIFLAMSQDKVLKGAKCKVYSLPLTEEARNLGRENVANVIGLGALASISGVISGTSLQNTLKKRFSGAIFELNLEAFSKGFEMGQQQEF